MSHPSPTLLWWYALCAVSAANAVAWMLFARGHLRDRSAIRAAGAAAAPRWGSGWQLVFCGGYVAGCAFRSVFPVFDVPRLGLVESPLSSVLIGRSVATVAELSFVAQWALLTGWVARRTGDRFCAALSRGLLPMIGVAEICSWYSVLSTSNLGHVFEESLWGTAGALLAAALLAVRPRCARPVRGPLLAIGLAAAGYAAYMFAVDVPMYASRWLADEAQRRSYLDLARGLAEVASTIRISDRWEHWHTEVVWMSAYFSIGVWTSLWLVRLHRRHDPGNGTPA